MIKIHFILNMVGIIKTSVIHTHTQIHTHTCEKGFRERNRGREKHRTEHSWQLSGQDPVVI